MNEVHVSDIFSVRTLFKDHIQKKLSASQIQRIVDFCYLNRQFYEELFILLIENLASTPPLNRLNVFYVLDSLCKHSAKFQFYGYTDQIVAKLDEIVALVVDSNSDDGIANVYQLRKVLCLWKSKSILRNEIFERVDSFLKGILEKAKCTLTLPIVNNESNMKDPNVILKRMEEDRERQKRSREETWIVPVPEDSLGQIVDGDVEFDRGWAAVTSMTESDFALMNYYQELYNSNLEE